MSANTSEAFHVEQQVSQESLATLGLCLAMVAHEVNNILTPVKAGADLALRHPTDQDTAHRALKRASEGSARASTIMQSLLAIARGSGVEAAKPCDLRDAVEQVVHAMGRNPARDGITLAIHVPRGTLVRANAPLLQQALMNLLLNAWTALMTMPGASRTLTVRCHDDAGGLQLDIVDSGPGLPENIASNPFKPFQAATSGDRCGLGLSIASHLIRAAGGEIALASTGPTGTTWRLTLQRVAATAKTAA